MCLIYHENVIVFLYRSPGFGLTLVAETINGAFLCAETASNPKGSEEAPTVPEDLGVNTAKLLLEEIYRVCTIYFPILNCVKMP